MRLIDADALEEQLSDKAKEMLGIAEQCQGLAINYYTGAKYGFAKAAIIANGLPTIEPKRGKWIKDGVRNALYKCSACNDLCAVAGWANCIPEEQMYKSFKFCPNCGARMERSEDGET